MTDGKENQGDVLAHDGGQPRPDEQQPSVKTFTQEELDKLMSERHRGLNKQIDALTKEKTTIAKERDGFKSKLSEAESALQQATAAREQAEKDYDEAIAGDADQIELAKLKREWRTKIAAEREAIKTERRAFEAEREAHNTEWETREQKIKESEEETRNALIFNVATSVKGDAQKLKDEAEALNVTTEEGLKRLARNMWPEPVIVADSGRNVGGGGIDLRTTNEDELLKRGFRKRK